MNIYIQDVIKISLKAGMLLGGENYSFAAPFICQELQIETKRGDPIVLSLFQEVANPAKLEIAEGVLEIAEGVLVGSPEVPDDTK